MRTAICFSGQPRGVATCWRSAWEHLIRHLPNPDVFIHSSQPYSNVPQEFYDILHPVKVVIEDQYPFPHIEDILSRTRYYDNGHRNSYLQQIFGWKRVGEVKKEHENSTGVKYDLAVRIRPDLIFLQDVPLATLELDKVNTLHGVGPGVAAMPVEFAIGPDQLMDKYFGCFDWLCAEGEKHLKSDNWRILLGGYNHYNCDLIMATYMIDALGVPVARNNLSPYSYYRIKHLHDMGIYQ
jgi:hypothetical protein